MCRAAYRKKGGYDSFIARCDASGKAMSNIRLINTQGSDEFNCEAPDGRVHSFKVRPDGSWIVPHEVAIIVCNDGRSGFVEHADDEKTLSEIKLLASVLAQDDG
jgi:hypothetical protein